MIHVTHYRPKSRPGWYSLERLFSDVRGALPIDITVVVQESSFLSNGLLRRLYNMIEAFLGRLK